MGGPFEETAEDGELPEVRRIAALARLQRASVANGLVSMTDEEIQEEINAARRERSLQEQPRTSSG